jgi:hypothetical protein
MSRTLADPTEAYEPVHAACGTLLHAIKELTSHYGRAWLQWDLAQEDIARLRAALSPD